MKKIKICISIMAIFLGAWILWAVLSGLGESGLTVEEQVQKEVFFRHTIPNAEMKFRQDNQRAIERLEERIEVRFQQWESKIPEFVKDVTDLGSKTKIAGKSLSDFVNRTRGKDDNAKEVQIYVQTIFEKHLFSSDELNQAVEEIAQQFVDDISSNRKVFYFELQKDWEEYRFDSRSFPSDELSKRTDLRMNQFVQDHVYKMMGESLGGLVGSELVSVATTYLVKQIVMQAGVRLAAGASGAAASGAASGAAAGGAAGAVCGPGCVAIGVGTGFVAGLIIDWVVTEITRENMSDGLMLMLDEIQVSLVEGSELEMGLIRFYSEYEQRLVDEEVKTIQELE